MSYLRKEGKNYSLEFYYGGRKYHKSLGVSEYKAAKKIQSQIDYEISMGSLDPSFLDRSSKQGIRLAGFIDEWKKYLPIMVTKNGKKIKPRTKTDYEETADKLLDILGDIDIRRLDDVLVEKKVMGYFLANYSMGSVRHHLINLRKMLNVAIKWGYVQKNPFSGRVPGPVNDVPRYFRDDEIEVIREYFSDPRHPKWQVDFVFLAINTGLRRKELLRLKWPDHVDLGKEQVMPYGKNDKSRMVPLNYEALRILKNRLRHIKNPKVFWEIKNESAVSSMWRRFQMKTKINGRFHDLRHTYASYFVMNGGNLYHLKDILGHSDIQTVQIYAKLAPDSLHRDKNCVNFEIKKNSGVDLLSSSLKCDNTAM